MDEAWNCRDLSCNSLNGSIPANLGKLAGLKELDLESNRLTGGIPAALENLAGLVILNVSFNHLSGEIPRGKSLAQFGSTSFVGNSELCGAPWSISCPEVLPATPIIPANNVTNKERRPALTTTGISIIAIAAAVVVALFVISVLSLVIKRKKKSTKWESDVESNSDDGLVSLETPMGRLVLLNGVQPSHYDDCVEKGVGTLLEETTVIGRGSIGTVYRATIGDDITIAVKKLDTVERMRDAEEFEADMRSLDNIQHQNLVMLQGYYLSATLKLILSEFVPNGTLSELLHGNPSAMPLTWLQRHKIGLGIARGLVQLHCNHGYVTCPKQWLT